MISPDDFQLLSALVKKRSGITLSEEKTYLFESRLLPLARSRKLEGISELCQKVLTQPSEELLADITEAMTTNESSFFRDIKPFEQLKKLLFPMLMKTLSSQKKMRFWSAACSTGQEPYSIAISLREDADKMPGWYTDIIATDLAQKVIDKAKSGIYTQFEAQRGLPIQMLLKYFTVLPDSNWQVQEQVRNMVQFKNYNLLDDYSTLGKFDVIFCRNVLIYFDDATKATITDKMSRSLQAHGTLILGSTETLIDPGNKFTQVDDFRGAYRLTPALKEF